MIRIHARLQPRLREQLHTEVSLLDMFFGHPTIADLVRHAGEGGGNHHGAAGTGAAWPGTDASDSQAPRGRRRNRGPQ
jgi:hypothetical protein